MSRFQGAANIEDDDFKRAFVDDVLVIDCREIRLVQLGAKSPIEYAGSGSIEVGAKKGVIVRLVLPRSATDPYDPIKFLKSLNGHKPGVIVPDDHYYRLTAKDVAGEDWVCESGVLDRGDREDTVVLCYTAPRIVCTAASDAPKDYAYMVFLDDLGFPKNTVRTTTVEKGGERWSTQTKQDLSAGDSAGFDLTFEGVNARPERPYSEFVAVAQVDTETPAGFEDRLLEAIRFCTATMATPTMSQVSRGGTRFIELTQARDLNKGLAEPPVTRRGHELDFFRLFGCYYLYACAHAGGKSYSPLSAAVGGLFALKGVWIETVVLLLSVAVERVLNDETFSQFGKPGPDVKVEVDKILNAVGELELSQSMLNRVNGSLNGFRKNSTADQLHALIVAGVLEEDDRRIWKKSRNSTAHGSFEIEPAELQRVIDSAFRLMTLIYKLVFLRIGYAGNYTNFAVRGWPAYFFDLARYQEALAGGTEAAGAKNEN